MLPMKTKRDYQERIGRPSSPQNGTICKLSPYMVDENTLFFLDQGLFLKIDAVTDCFITNPIFNNGVTMKLKICQVQHPVTTFSSESIECVECGVRFDEKDIASNLYGADGPFICLECRYQLLRHKYRRLQKAFRILQRAFAEVKFALLNREGNWREVILGICEAYRGKFDVKFD